MTALITALDNYNFNKIGEKGHVEYCWSSHVREKILQLSFQVTRTDENGVAKLQEILKDILQTLKMKTTLSVLDEESNMYLSILYRMIGHTRDVIDGKGEYTLTYMMIYTWYEYYQELAFFALKCIVDLGDKNVHQYGSWKDIKYFCDYCRKQSKTEEHPLINYAITITNEQLSQDDCDNFWDSRKDISLVSKWIPRESSSFGWLFQHMATNYFPEYILSAKSPEAKIKSILKCKAQYRKIVSCLNKKLDTLQIKQCDRNWGNIDFNKVTSISLSKQKKAFLNIKQNDEVRYTDNPDRIMCSEHFKEHINKAIKGGVEMKGKRIGMDFFTKQALELCSCQNNTIDLQFQIDLLNSQWRDNATQTNALSNFIAMVDVSSSMEGSPKHAAMALGIRVAEKSKLGKRIMTFSSKPSWVNLESENDFFSMIKLISSTSSGLNTNFYIAMNLILDAIIDSKLPPEEVEDMVLAIFSDMQIDRADLTTNKVSMYDSIKEKYSAAGIRLYGKPFKPPHILLWNLRSTDGFPCLSHQENVSMMSGFNPSLLNIFCEQGVCALNSCTPWTVLINTLENKRYKIMGDKITNIIN